MKKLKICVLGGGIFGLTAAHHLSDLARIIHVYEKNDDILQGATKFNHNRHHYGFHYPRSKETIHQCLESAISFEKIFKSCLDFNFNNYYAVSKINTKIPFNKYQNLFSRNLLEVETPRNIFNTRLINKCFLVKEGVYNYNKLRKKIISRLKKNIVIQYNSLASLNEYSKNSIKINNKILYYDVIINATYDNLNYLIPDKEKIFFEYNLQEMCIIKLKKKRFAATIVDGEFPSVLPFSGYKDNYLFAHAKNSQLIKKTSYLKPDVIKNINFFNSNWKKILETSKVFLPILNNCEYIKSFFSIRMVKPNSLDTRASEIINHGNNFYSLFSGKIITVEDICFKLKNLIKKI